VSESWYRIALAGTGPAPIVVVAPGQHLGAAIDVAARRLGKDVWPVAASLASGSEVPLGESVGKGVVVERGPAPDLALGFRWPRGVVPDFTDAARTDMAAGWTRRAADGLAVIEAQVGGDQLGEIFLELVERLPVADNLEVKVMGHHDDAGTTEVWLSPHLDVKRAIRFLDDHDVELVDNGHVELSLYLRSERSTLRLTEHKTLLWLSEDPAAADRFVRWLGELEVPRAPQLVTAADLVHFHYRPARSRPRGKLVDRLRRLRLRRVDSWRDQPAPAPAP
jgi:hypothetical protein